MNIFPTILTNCRMCAKLLPEHIQGHNCCEERIGRRETMARINKAALTKIEIVIEATKQFLEKGYTSTTVAAIAKGIGMSQGNLTFHFPTKEHLLAKLTDILCQYQWQMMKDEANDGISQIMAICLELTTMIYVCDTDEVMKDFYLSTYTSPICLDIIRRNDAKRAKEVFAEYCPDWTDEQFAAAQVVVSGIEYASLMNAGEPLPLETRIGTALQNILSVYNVPAEIQETKLKKVFAKDYHKISKQMVENFKEFADKANDEAFHEIINA